MKNNLLLLLMALLGVVAACKKDKSSPQEPALGYFLADSTVKISKVKLGENGIELGYRFYASRRGKIAHLGSRMPDAGTYTVSLWDFDTKALLVQQTVEQTAPNVLKLESIPPVTVQPNKKYVISLHYTAPKLAYVIQSKDASALLPFTKGSITIVNAQFRDNSASTFPLNTDNLAIYGYPELVFVAD